MSKESNVSEKRIDALMFGLFFGTLGLFLFICLLPIWHEQSAIFVFSRFLYGLAGKFSLALAILLFSMGCIKLLGITREFSLRSKIFAILCVLFLICALHVISCRTYIDTQVAAEGSVKMGPFISESFKNGANTAGGIVFGILTSPLLSIANKTISIIVYFALSALFLSLILFKFVFKNKEENKDNKDRVNNEIPPQADIDDITRNISDQPGQNATLQGSGLLSGLDEMLRPDPRGEINYTNESVADPDASFLRGFDSINSVHNSNVDGATGRTDMPIPATTRVDPTYVNQPTTKLERERFEDRAEDADERDKRGFKLIQGLKKTIENHIKQQNGAVGGDERPSGISPFLDQPQEQPTPAVYPATRTATAARANPNGYASPMLDRTDTENDEHEVIDRYLPMNEGVDQPRYTFPNSTPVQRVAVQSGATEGTVGPYTEPRREIPQPAESNNNSFVPDMTRVQTEGERQIPQQRQQTTPRQPAQRRVDRQNIPQSATVEEDPYAMPSAPSVGMSDDNWEDELKDIASDDYSIYNYNRPPLDNLEKGQVTVLSEAMKAKLQADSETIVRTLEQFRIKVTVQEVEKGTSVIRFKLKLGEGVKISTLKGLVDNLSAALHAPSAVSIEQIYSTEYVAVEVALTEPEKVCFRDIVESNEFEYGPGLQIAYGKTIDGKVMTLNLQKMPHLLVAGSTGSGKSVFLNSLICGLISKYSPMDLKLILFDPKRVEMQAYSNLPHMLFPESLKDVDKMVNVFKFLCNLMQDRYKLFNEVSTDVTLIRDIDEYNEAYPAKKIPKIVVIIDEYAQMCSEKQYIRDIEDCIKQLAQLARAAGIHVVLATQRPSVDVITGVIKNNFPKRISFKVSASQDSKTIIERAGAEKLIGKGDSYYVDGEKIVRVQSCYLSNSEIMDIVNYIKRHNPPARYNEKVQQVLEVHDEDDAEQTAAQPQRRGMIETEDEFAQRKKDEFCHSPYAYKILSTIVETQKATVTMLSSICPIGYPKAAKFMNTMEKLGVVSKADPINNSRQVLIHSIEELNERCIEWGVEIPE